MIANPVIVSFNKVQEFWIIGSRNWRKVGLSLTILVESLNTHLALHFLNMNMQRLCILILSVSIIQLISQFFSVVGDSLDFCREIVVIWKCLLMDRSTTSFKPCVFVFDVIGKILSISLHYIRNMLRGSLFFQGNQGFSDVFLTVLSLFIRYGQYFFCFDASSF